MKLKSIFPKIISGIGISFLILLHISLYNYYWGLIIYYQTDKFSNIEEYSQIITSIWLTLYPYIFSILMIIPALKEDILQTITYYFFTIIACLMIYSRDL